MIRWRDSTLEEKLGERFGFFFSIGEGGECSSLEAPKF